MSLVQCGLSHPLRLNNQVTLGTPVPAGAPGLCFVPAAQMLVSHCRPPRGSIRGRDVMGIPAGRLGGQEYARTRLGRHLRTAQTAGPAARENSPALGTGGRFRAFRRVGGNSAAPVPVCFQPAWHEAGAFECPWGCPCQQVIPRLIGPLKAASFPLNGPAPLPIAPDRIAITS